MKTRPNCPVCAGVKTTNVIKHNNLVGIHSLGRERIPMPLSFSRANYVACASCGLIFAKNVQDHDEYCNYYKAFRQTGRRATREVDMGPERPERTRAAINALLDERFAHQPVRSVLYFRPDDPSIISNLLSNGPLRRLIIVDYFPHLFHRFEESDSRVRVFDNSVELGVSDDVLRLGESFDLIVSAHQLTHSFEPLNFLLDCRRLLTEAGEIVTYHDDDHSIRPFRFVSEGPNNFHKQLFTPRTMASTLATAGLVGPVVSSTQLGITATVRKAESRPPFVTGVDVELVSEIRTASRKSSFRRGRRHLREWRRVPQRLLLR